MADQEVYADMSFPRSGMDLSNSFSQQDQDTTRLGLNVRTFEPLTDRGRGGQRPGLIQFIPEALPLLYTHGSRLIQNLNFVVRDSQEALLDNLDFGDLPGEDSSLAVDDPSGPGRFYGPPGDPDFPGTGDEPDTPDQQRCRRLGRGGCNDGPFPPTSKGRGKTAHTRPGGTGRQPSRTSRKHPVLTWPNPSQKCQGDPLTRGAPGAPGFDLNAIASDPNTGATIPGDYSYDPPEGTVLALGLAQTLHVLFAPDNATKYAPAEKSVLINVIDCGGGGGGGGGGGTTRCTLIHALISDFGYNCLALCSPDSLGDQDNFSHSGNTYTQEIADGQIEVRGSIDVPGENAPSQVIGCPPGV